MGERFPSEADDGYGPLPGESEVSYTAEGYRQTLYELGPEGYRIVVDDPVTGSVISEMSYTDE